MNRTLHFCTRWWLKPHGWMTPVQRTAFIHFLWRGSSPLLKSSHQSCACARDEEGFCTGSLLERFLYSFARDGDEKPMDEWHKFRGRRSFTFYDVATHPTKVQSPDVLILRVWIRFCTSSFARTFPVLDSKELCIFAVIEARIEASRDLRRFSDFNAVVLSYGWCFVI